MTCVLYLPQNLYRFHSIHFSLIVMAVIESRVNKGWINLSLTEPAATTDFRNKMGLLWKLIFSFSVSFSLLLPVLDLAIQLQLSRKEIIQTQPILERFGKKHILALRLPCVGKLVKTNFHGKSKFQDANRLTRLANRITDLESVRLMKLYRDTSSLYVFQVNTPTFVQQLRLAFCVSQQRHIFSE